MSRLELLTGASPPLNDVEASKVRVFQLRGQACVHQDSIGKGSSGLIEILTRQLEYVASSAEVDATALLPALFIECESSTLRTELLTKVTPPTNLEELFKTSHSLISTTAISEEMPPPWSQRVKPQWF